MLLAAGYELPRRIFAHGFMTVDGQKISKSLGNVIDPVYLAERYSPDVLRYFLVREISFGQDGDFSEGNLQKRLNDELADVLGNFVHRVLTFTKSRFGGKVPEAEIDENFFSEVREKVQEVENLMENFAITQALLEILGLARRGNEYFQSQRPWETIRAEPQKAAACILNSINLSKILCVLLTPFMPGVAGEMEKQLNYRVKRLEQARVFDIKSGHEIGEPKPIFQKVEFSEFKGSQVSLKEFQKLDLRVGRVLSVARIPETKLLKLVVDLGTEKRELVAGIADQYSPEDLEGKDVVVLSNLRPARFRGELSEGMLLAADDDGKVSLLIPDKPVRPGAKVR
jgi:methionyl-tRNA synthetase